MDMIRVSRCISTNGSNTMVWGDDRDLNLVVHIGSDVYTLYNKGVEVDHTIASVSVLPYHYSDMVRMLSRGPSNEDLERFAAHFSLQVVERPDSLSLATLPTHNVGWAPESSGCDRRFCGSSCFTWMMEEVEKELRKGTSAEELFPALVAARVKSVDCSERQIRVTIPLKPLLQLVEAAARGVGQADGHWQHKKNIAEALGTLWFPREHQLYFMGSPALRVQSDNAHSDVWDIYYRLDDACPALPIVTRQMLVDAKMRIRTRAAIFIQKQWHKSICDPSYTMCKRRLMREFEFECECEWFECECEFECEWFECE